MSDQEDSFSEGEISYLCQKALFVQPASRSIDLTTIPADGSEYIHKSRLEAALLKYPEVNNVEESNSSAGKEVLKVDKFWKRRAAVEFSNFAYRLKTDREVLKERYPQSVIIPLDDEIGCCTFCLGSEKCSKIYKCSPLSYEEANLPLLRYVIHLNQFEIHKLLKYSFKWYKAIGMDVEINRWVFSFLACTDKPIPKRLEQFLEKYFDDCRMHLKNCEEEEFQRVHLIMSLLENYFCIKSKTCDTFFSNLF